jgi:DNA-binding response OmpR family regulator
MEENIMEKKILIVDDEKDFVRILTTRLENAGYQVAVAFDPVQALTQATQLKPDLILLDIRMPAGGGLAALKSTRANDKTFNMPVIALTAVSDEQTREDAEKLGISGYFVKPVDMGGLLEKIRQVLV